MNLNFNLTSLRIEWDFLCKMFFERIFIVLCQALLCLRVLLFDHLLRRFLKKGSRTNYWPSPATKNIRYILPHIERMLQISFVLATFFCRMGLSCKMFSKRILCYLKSGFILLRVLLLNYILF